VTQPILDPAVLASLGDLELVARVIVDGALSGLHESPFHGYSAEFSEYRHYRVGDDLKYIDWKLFARSDRVYTKQFRETTNVAAQVIVDASRSMAFAAGVTKLDYARLLAAALTHLIVGQGDAAGLAVYDQTIREFVPPRTGHSHARAILAALARMRAVGGTSTVAALRRAVDLLKRRGLLLIISDLYDDGDEVERELKRAVGIGHDVAVFHVLTRAELELPFTRSVELEDLETGQTIVTGAAAATTYRRAFAEFLESCRARCARYGVDYTRILTDVPLDAALRGYLLRRAGSRAR
jgi:uncharacterized protein (DUF58 family)